MRCQNCADLLVGPSYIVTKVLVEGRDLTVNLCRACMERLIGHGPRRSLDNALFNTRFITQRLPGL